MVDTLIGSMDVVTCRRRRRRNESDSSSEKMNDCESLLIEILTRLHCREAIKSKLVCKRWNSIISSDHFVTAFNHRRHDPSHDPSYRLIFQFLHRLGSRNPVYEYEYSSIVHCGSNSKPPLLDLEFLPCWTNRGVAIVASCDDLILCTFACNPNSQFTNYFVCNVQTKQWFALPPAPNSHDNSDYVVGFLCFPSPCSLCNDREREGVDNSRYKFMVLRIRRVHILSFTTLTLSEVELFQAEDGEWTRHEVSPPLNLRRRHESNMVPYKGMLHWITGPYVLVFDRHGQISRVIRIRLGGFRSFNYICSFDVYQDRLRVVFAELFKYPNCYHYYIFELEDYDIGRWSFVNKVGGGRLGVAYTYPDGNAACCNDQKSDNTCTIWLRNLLSQAPNHKFKLVSRYDKRYSSVPEVNAHRVTD